MQRATVIPYSRDRAKRAPSGGICRTMAALKTYLVSNIIFRVEAVGAKKERHENFWC